jgi:hypothetical protein
MALSTWLFVGLGFAMPAAQPPVVAPKPAAQIKTPACAICGFSLGATVTPLTGPMRTGRTLPVAGAVPEPLRLPADASPLSPSDPNPRLRELIDQHLPHASEEERDAWFSELRSLPIDIARDLLTARTRPRPAASRHRNGNRSYPSILFPRPIVSPTSPSQKPIPRLRCSC